MTDEQSRAVSFANSYFTLVDGLASGLEDYLAGDVILDWFGRTVRGKRNVSTFMKAHKVNSRHIFSNIVPRESIGYRKYHLNRKTINLFTNAHKNLNENVKHSLNSLQTTDNEGNLLNEEEGVSYELGYNDLNGLTKLEITPTIVDEIEWNIEKMRKLKFENEIMERKVDQKCCQADGLGQIEVETKRVKFVEATGEMHLWRNYAEAYDTLPSSYIWKRPCKLQIAYSLIKYNSLDNSTNLNTHPQMKSAISEFQRKKLPSLDEISEMNNRLIPNINNFGGYLRQMNFSEDRDNFLKFFGDELAASDSQFPRYVPQYVGNRLVFRKKNFQGCDESNFVFNYQIHMIIYEGEKM